MKVLPSGLSHRLLRWLGRGMPLQGRLVALIALAMLPALGLAYFDARQAHDERLRNTRADIRSLSAGLASAYSEFFVGSRELLSGLAAQPAIRTFAEPACSTTVRRVARSHQGYTTFVVLDVRGRARCASAGLVGDRSPDFSRRDWFRAAVSSKHVVVGRVRIGAISRLPVLVTAYPVIEKGAVIAVVAGGVRLTELQRIASVARFPSGTVVVVLDESGKVVARIPVVPSQVAKPHPVAAIRAARPNTQFQGRADDGVEYLWTVSDAAPLRVLVGRPASGIESAARSRLVTTTILIFVAALVASALVLVGTSRLLGRPIRRLVEASEQLAKGDLDTKVDTSVLTGNFAHLGDAFNDMASALSVHLDQQRQAEERLLEVNAKLEERVKVRTAELSRLNAALEVARSEAERANIAKTLLLRRVSHELRTPLNAMLGFSQLLEMDERNPERRDSLERIQRAGHHLVSLIDEMLDIARVESGALGLTIEDVPVEEVISDALEVVEAIAEPAGVDVVRESSWIVARADRQRLLEVLLNLLGNAVNYTDPGGRVELRATAEGGRVRIEIEDTGIGIPEAELADLFTPFVRLPAGAEHAHGSGLGLAMSKAFVEAMGGTIGVVSTPGIGSTFWIDLPGTT